MQCTLCQKNIEPYDKELHQLQLTKTRSVDICNACSEAITNWNNKKFAKLFPTKALKKMYAK